MDDKQQISKPGSNKISNSTRFKEDENGEENDNAAKQRLCPEDCGKKIGRFSKTSFRFLRPLLLLQALDIMVALVCDYFTEFSNSWCAKGFAECWILLSLIHAFFFYKSAETIEKETATLVRLKGNALPSFDEKESSGAAEAMEKPLLSGSNTKDVKDDDLIYGKAAVSIDTFLASYCDSTVSTGNGSTNIKNCNASRSMLSHLCWILFCYSIALGSSSIPHLYFRGNEEVCPKVGTTRINSLKINPDDKYEMMLANYTPTNKISEYPGDKDLETWIVGDFDPGDATFDFPTISPWTDRYAPKTVTTKNRMISTEKDSVLVEHVSGPEGFVAHYHPDIRYPFLFVPVQSTLIRGNSTINNKKKKRHEEVRADQYCFSSYDHVGQDEWAYKMLVYCLENTTGLPYDQPAIVRNTSYYTTVPNERGQTMAASYGDAVYFCSSSPHRYRRHAYFREVYRIDPNTMETDLVYSNVSEVVIREVIRRRRITNGRDDLGRLDWLGLGFVIEAFAAICGLGIVVVHLLFQKGVDSGAAFLGWGLVFLVQESPLYYDDGWVCLVVTVFHQCLIKSHATSSRVKLLCIWSLYGVLIPMAAINLFRLGPYGSDFSISLFYLAFNGVLLGHPMFQVVGCGICLSAAINFYLVWILCGFGCIMIGNWFTANRHWYYPRVKYLFRTICRATKDVWRAL